MHMALGAQPFNYSDAIDALPNSILAFGSSAQSSSNGGAADNNVVIDNNGLFNDTLPKDAPNTTVSADPDLSGA